MWDRDFRGLIITIETLIFHFNQYEMELPVSLPVSKRKKMAKNLNFFLKFNWLYNAVILGELEILLIVLYT